MTNLLTEADSTPTPTLPLAAEATEADFEQWLTELLPGIRAAIAQQDFSKIQRLSAFQTFVQQRNKA